MRHAPGAVLLFAAILFLWNLGGYDLWAPDEPYFAEGAREMLADGHWIVPHVNGTLTTDKPPLFFWVVAGVSLPAGEVTSWTARLPSALASLASVALTMRLAGRLLGAASGPLAGAVLATTYLFWDKARSAQIDALLSLLVLGTVYAFVRVREEAWGAARGGAIFWGCAALAVLAKGPVGLLLPLGVAAAVSALDRDARPWRRLVPWWGPLLFAGLVGSWVALAHGRDGYSVWAALREHFFERAARGMHHVQPPWYYAQVLPAHLLPWTGVVLGGAVVAARRRDATARLLLGWAGFVVLFFSISTEKRGLYVLPAYPAFAMLAAAFARRAEGEDRGARSWLAAALGVPAGAYVLGAVALPLLRERLPQQALDAALVLSVALAVSGAVALVALASALRRGLWTVAAGTGVVYFVVAATVHPALDPVKSARAFATTVARITGHPDAAGKPIVTAGLGNVPEAIAYYTRGLYTEERSGAEAVARHFQEEGGRFAIVSREVYEALPEELRRGLSIRARARVSRADALLLERARGAP